MTIMCDAPVLSALGQKRTSHPLFEQLVKSGESWTEVQLEWNWIGCPLRITGGRSHWRVRFSPNSDREGGFPQGIMSALPPEADGLPRGSHVCFTAVSPYPAARNKAGYYCAFSIAMLKMAKRLIRDGGSGNPAIRGEVTQHDSRVA
jgi:hypothetical protein